MTTQDKVRVLLVEDNLPDARYVEELLPTNKYALVRVDALAAAYSCFSECEFDVILLDLSLPDGQGIETFLSMTGKAPNVPIVILTGLDDEEVAIAAVRLGAQDYVQKREINQHTLCRSIQYAIERRQALENAKRLSVLEHREEFMATLTHDLKNPLLGANYLLEVLAEETRGKIAPEQTNILLQLRDSNKLLLSMIQNLIEVYRFEKDVSTIVPENTDLLNIACACLTDVAPIAQNRRIVLKSEIPKQIKNILADANAIRRVLQNLLDNALKFTPTGGEVTLKLQASNGFVVVEIIDTGPGISTEDQKKLFQRFVQGRAGKKYTPGTGLGLYLCKQIVDAHRGEIACISSEGAGTTFRVSLPVVA